MIVCANALALPFPDKTFDIAVTSPPYNLGKNYGSDDKLAYEQYRAFIGETVRALAKALKDDARLCINVPFDTNLGGKRFIASDWHEALTVGGFTFQTCIVWNEGNISARTAWGSFAKASAPFVTTPCEAILVYYRGDQWKRAPNGRTSMIERQEFIDWTLGIWSIPGESAKRIGHPAPYPVEIPRRLLKIYAYQEDLVLDPFGGSGTTTVAADALGMRSVSIDLQPEWCELATSRSSYGRDSRESRDSKSAGL